MELDVNSFLIKKFLKIEHVRHLPKSVCDLVWKIFTKSIFYLLQIATVALVGLFVIIVIRAAFFGDALISVESAIVVVSVAMTVMLYIGYHIFEKMNNWLISPKPPSVLVATVEGMWDRITKKTCNIIEYKNLPKNSNYLD